MKVEDMTAVIDLDMIKYTVSSISQENSIDVTFKESGKVKNFKNRTAFYGHHIKKAGGWLADLNSKREEKGQKTFSVDEFDITDKVTALPIANALHTAKLAVPRLLAQVGTERYISLMGEGDSFRVDLSTLKKYKGNRDNLVKPIQMDEIVEYIKKRYSPEVVTGLEADDKIVMEAYKRPDRFVLGEDKDYYGQPVKFFNVRKPEEGIVDCDCFGKLWLEGKNKKVRGYGRMFLYFQWTSGDAVDNFKANSHSDRSWGEKSAYKRLEGCTDDEHALQEVRQIFQDLYPGAKEIEGWRGDTITIDWEYCLTEIFHMARMVRFEGDEICPVKLVNGDSKELKKFIGEEV